MQADLICVGNEILTGLIENSNAGFLARRLWSQGIPVRETAVVADDEQSIRDTLERALKKSEVIIITGGLGPTEDDLTREAVASIFGLSLNYDRMWLERMEEFFRQRGINMPYSNRKQAMVIEGSTLLENKRGTAPGALLEREGRLIALLPGPPYEMQMIFDEQVLPVLVKRNGGSLSAVKTLKCIGIGESMLEQKIQELGKWNLPPISYVARGYEVNLQIKGYGKREEADAAVAEAEKKLRDALGDAIYGSDDDTLAGLAASLLIKKGMTLALAESCSGGLLSDLVTDIPGCSSFYRGGIIAYSADAKIELLGLNAGLLEKKGEVSAGVAEAMAEGARKICKSDYAIGITGVAGPGSDQAGNPVGLVYIALVGPKQADLRQLNLGGARKAIKERAAQIALDMLRKAIARS